MGIDPRHLAYAEAAQKAGCPRDQIANFSKWGYVSQPKQLEFHAAARAADHDNGPVHIALGGDRGGSKSHAIMAQVMLDDCQRYPGLRCLILRKIGKAAKEALEELRKKIFIGIPHNFNRNEGIVRFENGSTVVVGHFASDRDIDQYVGIEYDIIVPEENTQISGAKIDELMGSLRSTKPGWRARSYRAANPGGIGHVDFKNTFVVPYRLGKETITKFIPISWRDNVFVRPEYIAYLDSLKGPLRKMWRDGDWDVIAGAFFAGFDPEHHVIGHYTPAPHIPIWASMDHGFTHWTMIYLHALEKGMIYTFRELAFRKTLIEQIAPKVHDSLAEFGRTVDDLHAFAAGHDVFANRGGNALAARTIAEQYADYGIWLDRAYVDRVNGAGRITNLLGNPSGEQPTPSGVRITADCQRLIECLPMLQSDPKRPEDVLKWDCDPQGNGGDDPYDGWRYGIMAESQVDTAPLAA